MLTASPQQQPSGILTVILTSRPWGRRLFHRRWPGRGPGEPFSRRCVRQTLKPTRGESCRSILVECA
jgi:hypothetical protein